MSIRKAGVEDVSRIAEILVFSKRKNYRNIFNNDIGSFVELQVYPLIKTYLEHKELLENIFVYDDEFVKGLISIDGTEIKELYVDPFFEGKSIGEKLLNFAVSENDCQKLWVLDQNEKAKRFYHKHGFFETGQSREVPEAPGSKILEVEMVKKKLSR